MTTISDVCTYLHGFLRSLYIRKVNIYMPIRGKKKLLSKLNRNRHMHVLTTKENIFVGGVIFEVYTLGGSGISSKW